MWKRPPRGIRPADAGNDTIERFRVEDLPQGRHDHLDLRKLPRRAGCGREHCFITKARSRTSPNANAPRSKSAGRPPNCPAAGRNCAPKTDHGGEPPHGARNPARHVAAAISGFSTQCRRQSKAPFNSSTATSPPKPSAAIFSASPRLSDTEVGVFICDVAGHGVRAALVTAMIRALAEELKPLRATPAMFLRKLNFDLVQHPQKHRLADAHHGVLFRRRLADRRRALCQRRPSQAADHPPRRSNASNRSPTPAATASPPSACLMTRLIRPPKPRSRPAIS